MSAVTVWRLCVDYRRSLAFSGEGAFRRGGRWNPAGVRVIYCAESRALAALEVLVNVREADLLSASHWSAIPAEVPLEAIERPERVPDSWRTHPHSRETQAFGANWVKAARSAALRLPSAVVLGEFNYLLNPGHPDFEKIKIGAPETFSFDPRLSQSR